MAIVPGRSDFPQSCEYLEKTHLCGLLQLIEKLEEALVQGVYELNQTRSDSESASAY